MYTTGIESYRWLESYANMAGFKFMAHAGPVLRKMRSMNIKESFFEHLAPPMEEKFWKIESFPVEHDVIMKAEGITYVEHESDIGERCLCARPWSDDVGVVTFSNVRFLCCCMGFFVFKGDKISDWNAGFPLVSPEEFPESEERFDCIYLATDNRNSDNICHNLADVIPQYFLFKDYIKAESGMIGMVESKDKHVNYLRDLLAPGTIPIKPETVYSAGKLVVPAETLTTMPKPLQKNSHPALKGNAETIAKLRQVVQQTDTSPGFGPLLYLSRRDARNRRMINETCLLERLEDMGFTELCMGDLTPAEQISAVINAEIIVGAHGANLTNIFFCKPGATVIEIMPENIFTAAYATISHAVGLHYVPIFDTNPATQLRWELSQLSIERVAQMLTSLLQRPRKT